MQVRYPQLDFSEVAPHWTSNIEFAQMMNANGLVPAHIEPFLIKVMNRAKPLLDPVIDAQLLEDIDLFNKQEAQHYKMHRAANLMVKSSGYGGMEEYEKAYAADYERFLATKPLRWLLAYCDGFEASGSGMARVWVDGELDEMFAGGDLRPFDLWLWHLAEEFEHRDVVYRLYHRLYGRPKVLAWLYRVGMFVYAGKHIHGHTGRLRSYLLDKDREAMDPQQVVLSKQREKVAVSRFRRRTGLKLLVVFSPFYDPARLPKPKRLDAVLSRFG